MSYTWVDEDIIVCNNCGASTTLGHELAIEHYPFCTPGAAEYWEKYYENVEEDYD